MKTLLLLAACFCFLFYSCISNKKADVTPVANISATIDGVVENFNLNTRSSIFYPSHAVIIGNSQTSKDSIILNIEKIGATLVPGTYSTDSLGTYQERGSEILYMDNRDSVQYKYTGPYYTLGGTIYNLSNYNGDIIVTALSDSLCQGTFSATLISYKSIASLSGNGPIVTKAVTNGKFNIQLKNLKSTH